ISGLGLIIAGAIVISDVSDFNHFLDNNLFGPPIVLIVTGAIVFVIAFLGCFGAIKESYNLLIAVSIHQLIVCSSTWSCFYNRISCWNCCCCLYKSEFQDTLKDTLKKSLENYSQDEKIAWDNIQRKMMCCGVNGPSDWQDKGEDYPHSCCHGNGNPTDQVDSYCTNEGVGKYLYKTGCYDRLHMKVNSNAKILIGVGIGIAFIEIAGIFLACWLAQTIKKETVAT
ncbi:hypothetical protein NQ317_011982, partial [Molorchus minor]